jgi:hypothetical protein
MTNRQNGFVKGPVFQTDKTVLVNDKGPMVLQSNYIYCHLHTDIGMQT